MVPQGCFRRSYSRSSPTGAYLGRRMVSTTWVDFFVWAVFTVVNFPVFALRPIFVIFFAMV